MTDGSLAEELDAGQLDAIMTPFMPDGLLHPREPLPSPPAPTTRRPSSTTTASNGFVPGIHLVTLKREVVERHPLLPQAVQELFERVQAALAGAAAAADRHHPVAARRAEQDAQEVFGADWMPYGTAANAAMTAAFCAELHAQGIAPPPSTPRRSSPDEHLNTCRVAASSPQPRTGRPT